MRVLVTGVDGYLGSVVVPGLLQDGHDVVGLDTGYYRQGWLYDSREPSVHTLRRDVREVTVADLEGVDAVVHLAELSNDPLGELISGVTMEVNHLGSLHLAETARLAGATRFVHMSSCSVYGIADGIVDESSPTDPQTTYARCKLLVERDVGLLVDDAFSATFLRNATAFGASPRMRFDIVLNNLAGLAWTTGQITMTSDGSPWRPLVHALDIGKAIRCTLAAPREVVHGQVFNVGSDDQNYQVRDVAEHVAAAFPGCTTTFGPPDADNRSYRVSFAKISDQLPGFSCDWDAARGARQLHDVFAHIQLDSDTFTGRGHTRLAQLEHLLRTRQLDEQLYWTSPCA